MKSVRFAPTARGPIAGTRTILGRTLAWLVIVAAAAWAFAEQPAPAQQPGTGEAEQIFRTRVAPLLVSKCLTCHGTDNAEGGYSLATMELMRSPGDSARAPIVFGRPEASELFKRLTTSDEDERMPAESQPLSSDEIAAVQKWLRLGSPPSPPIQRQPLEQWIEQDSTWSAPIHYPRPLPINALAFGRDSKELIVGGYGEVTTWDIASGKLKLRQPVSGPFVGALQFHSDSQRLVVSSGVPGEFGVVELIDCSTSVGTRVPLITLGDVSPSVSFSPDALRIAVGGGDGILRILSPHRDGSLDSIELASHADAILDVAWSAAAPRLLTASRDRTAKLFDTKSWELLISYARHERAVGGVAFASGDPLTLDETGALRLMDGANLENDRHSVERNGLPRHLQRLVSQGELVAVPDANGLLLFRVGRTSKSEGEGQEKRTKTTLHLNHIDTLPPAGEGRIQSVAVDAPGVLLAVGTDRGEVWIYQNGKLSQRFVASP